MKKCKISPATLARTAALALALTNSFTPEAIEADDFLCQLKEHK